ncbi:hypothetical protein HYH03_018377 [Edaphochlamys debaryana]|uniref:Uncharacterized protein n=1 Tax=Edaphochlamys debaryana TaxID=47281 RepID=A0A835XKF9_9CHLO|nr:hypothetical protein HYH03_018377 [Edaphochlamys debaryana]|eukprot:KAG2482720.1 hypothetical protein HYH03_018377 [Edaphochlamys debaryana]
MAGAKREPGLGLAADACSHGPSVEGCWHAGAPEPEAGGVARLAGPTVRRPRGGLNEVRKGVFMCSR